MPFFKHLSQSIIPIFFIVILASCQKEISFETGTGAGSSTASFSLVAASGNCSDALAAGDYVVGTALSTTSNLVMVTVDVTKTGTWSYNTGTVKGFSFSGSGSFTTTGQQIIVLKGSGKPTETGSIAFPLNIGGATCSFAVAVTDGSTGDIYYKATIGGVNYYQAVTATNDYEAGSGLGGTDDVALGQVLIMPTRRCQRGLPNLVLIKD
jgi:hypothetical protein